MDSHSGGAGRSGSLPPEVRALLEQYRALVSATLPGRIEALYLVGSIALDDYRPGASDVDFVAVTAAPLQTDDLDRVERVHEEVQRGRGAPHFDGIYVTWTDLARDPSGLERIPGTLEGHFQRDRSFEANPSVWLTLHRYPRAMWGPAATEVWHDPEVVRRWNLENLNTYWRSQLAAVRSVRARVVMRADRNRLDAATVWLVSGVARLHYTIVTGDITSKSGACRYAMGQFPEHLHTVAQEALALRRGDPVADRSRIKRLGDIGDFLQFAIEDAAPFDNSNATHSSGFSPFHSPR